MSAGGPEADESLRKCPRPLWVQQATSRERPRGLRRRSRRLRSFAFTHALRVICPRCTIFVCSSFSQNAQEFDHRIWMNGGAVIAVKNNGWDRRTLSPATVTIRKEYIHCAVAREAGLRACSYGWATVVPRSQHALAPALPPASELGPSIGVERPRRGSWLRRAAPPGRKPALRVAISQSQERA
jgi:hypothetical protein